jgi:glycosyltransferase involved in cell wall biosynthesis
MKPLVSIIVPVYNIGEYVGKCLESVCGQSYENLEILVIDDGSTDESGKICDEFAAKDKRLKVYHKKNGGLSDARNFGISKAKGIYIIFIDGDDYIERNFVSRMIDVGSSNTDVVICGYNDVVPCEMVMSGKESAIRLLVKQENLDVIACNKMYGRKIFDDKNIRYPVNEKYEDSLTTYKILAGAKRVFYIPVSLYHYVIREGSIMNSADLISRLNAREKAAKEAVEYFSDDEELRQAAEIAVLTAKLAFMDAAAKGKIDKKYFKVNSEWIKKHNNMFQKHKFMNKKLNLYLKLNNLGLYKIFRTIV